MQKPFFSIMIPAYHLKDDIAAVLQSVLVQTFQDVEIGSSDELASIIPTAFARITDCSTNIERNLRDASWKRANGFYKAGIYKNTEGDALFFCYPAIYKPPFMGKCQSRLFFNKPT
ncbi:glycosyltransferase family 2 protein [Akkermansia muciniphila]|uniref:glycosyltransferase family 2 protein n=2 Tax=Akkermansia TaxID=239934 RepID=UPI000B8E48C7|nr:glycosyltransferase family 2 protein [Akkermansia muciniphila]